MDNQVVVDMNEQRLKAMDAVSDYSRIVNNILKQSSLQNEVLKKENENLKNEVSELKKKYEPQPGAPSPSNPEAPVTDKKTTA